MYIDKLYNKFYSDNDMYSMNILMNEIKALKSRMDELKSQLKDIKERRKYKRYGNGWGYHLWDRDDYEFDD